VGKGFVAGQRSDTIILAHLYLGNFPCAASHAGLICAAASLHRCSEHQRQGPRWRCTRW
jgi:hypothetical protein